MHTISKEQIEQAIAAIIDIEQPVDDAVDMLQGLLAQPEGQPVEYQWQSPFSQGTWRSVVKSEFDLLKKSDVVVSGVASVRALYTHPAPFTPISADDVTDEMVENFNKQFTNGAGATNDEMIAAAVNAWGAKQ